MEEKQYYIGKILIAKEDCMNNFYKGQAVEIEDIRDDEFLLDGAAYIHKDLVTKHFV